MKKVYDGFVLIMVALATTAVRDVVVFGATGAGLGSVGIALTAGAIGDDISVDTVGVYEFDGLNADTIAVGDILYWDGTYVTTTATANTRVGVSWSAKAGATDGVVNVKIG